MGDLITKLETNLPAKRLEQSSTSLDCIHSHLFCCNRAQAVVRTGSLTPPRSVPLALKNSLVFYLCSAFPSDRIAFHRSFCRGLCMDRTAVQCRRSEWGLCFLRPVDCFEFMVPPWSLTSALIPAGRVYLLFAACS